MDVCTCWAAEAPLVPPTLFFFTQSDVDLPLLHWMSPRLVLHKQEESLLQSLSALLEQFLHEKYIYPGLS